MATSSSFLSEDQFLCSICLDVFTEPVSVPCGHNFCKVCINRHSEGKEQYQCPLCNEKFNKGLKLCINTGFREVVENFKKQQAVADIDSPVKPGQVPCDCCLGIKIKASKTCLVCLTSYCETHLEPHRRVASLKRHKLTHPVHNLEDQICKKHNRMLELFCRNDQTTACVLCTEHSAHDTVLLEKACVEKRTQKGKKKVEVPEMKHRCGKRAQKMKAARRKGKDGAMPSGVVSNQKQDTLIWCIQHKDFPAGRYYREVQAERSPSWDLGDVREPMRGRRTFIPNPGNGNWVIRLGTEKYCEDCHDTPNHLFLIRKPERVVVLVDYDNGLVSFYDADTGIPAISFTDCKFNEMIYFFCSSRPEDDSWAQRLQYKVHMMKAWSQLPDTIFFFRCILILLLVPCIWIAFTT